MDTHSKEQKLNTRFEFGMLVKFTDNMNDKGKLIISDNNDANIIPCNLLAQTKGKFNNR